MSVTNGEYERVLEIAAELGSSPNELAVREYVGAALLDLLHADYFASYVWSESTRSFGDCVFVNMDPNNLQQYRDYFQFHDPITPKLQRFRRTVSVNEVIHQSELLKTEFYNDFLARDGLYYGVNLFAYYGDENIGDLRVWRGRHRENFGTRELQLLELLRPHFRNALWNQRRIARGLDAGDVQENRVRHGVLGVDELRARYGLTLREAQVACEVLQGRSDREISENLCISFSTTRTHLGRIFRKVGVHSRSALIYKMSLQH